jgi:hypothetical protein
MLTQQQFTTTVPNSVPQMFAQQPKAVQKSLLTALHALLADYEVNQVGNTTYYNVPEDIHEAMQRIVFMLLLETDNPTQTN